MEVSAKTNLNIKELLDLILLMFDLHPSVSSWYAQPSCRLLLLNRNWILGREPKATVIVRNGTLKVREDVQIDGQVFKVRSLFDTNGKPIQQASVGDAVEVLGFTDVPSVGSLIKDKSAQKAVSQDEKRPLTREMNYQREEEHKGISVILIADTKGSLEAIIHALPEGIKLITQKTGEVTEADILVSRKPAEVVFEFCAYKLKPDIITLAYSEKVLLRNYEIIYELLDEIKDALEGKIQSQMEQIFGSARVLAKFPFEKTFAFGISVLDGRITRQNSDYCAKKNQ